MVPGIYKRLILVLLFSGILLKSCYKEKLVEEDRPWNISGRVLVFDQAPAFCDKVDHILLYPLPGDTLATFSPHVSFGAYESISFDGKELLDGSRNELGQGKHDSLAAQALGKKSATHQDSQDATIEQDQYPGSRQQHQKSVPGRQL